ncbi:MAG: hypothetical protein H0X17_14590, partial [Deltaproteobacteria bacterium]|nr:hypothetical protein [Deltaproteobacteria bacterium]
TRATLARGRAALDVLGGKGDQLATSASALRTQFERRGPDAIRAFELAIERARAAIDKIDPLLAKVAEITGRLARGEGSLGRLMQDPEFPEDAKALGKIMKRQPWRIIMRPRDP